MPRSKLSQLPGAHIHQVNIAGVALGSDEEFAVFHNDTGATIRILSAGIIPDASVTGNDTNNLTLQLKSKVAAGTAKANVTAVKTYDTGTDLTAFKKDSLVLSTTLTDRDLLDGESLTLDKAETGSGLILPASVVAITYEFRG